MNNSEVLIVDLAYRIKTVILIPSFNETLALPALLQELNPQLDLSDAIIVVDDSPQKVFEEIRERCSIAMTQSRAHIYFLHTNLKSGRGGAVRRGMKLARQEFINLQYVLECDADGSHQPVDVIGIKNQNCNCDLLVGSRYLKESKIEGWPLSRKLFSSVLNFIIPRLFGIPLHDITNGLRRYSLSAVDLILNSDQINKGFIYLAEQALLVHNGGLSIDERPIFFINRTLGSTTVTLREVTASLKGIIYLYGSQRSKSKKK